MTTPSKDHTGGSPTGGDRHSGAPPHLSRKQHDKARDAVDGLRESAAGNVDQIADGIDAAASKLTDGQVGQLSGYVHEIADKLGGFSRDLREKSGDDMLRQVHRLAKDNPALFLTGSVVSGFALSRFARASRPDTRSPAEADTPAVAASKTRAKHDASAPMPAYTPTSTLGGTTS